MFFTDASGKKEMVYGSKPYTIFENAVLKLHPSASKKSYDQSWNALFIKHKSLTAKEFSELSVKPRQESEALLNDLTQKGFLVKINSKNGAIWLLK